MCGRYVRRSDKQKIAEHFAVHGPVLPEFGPSWNVAPQTFQPIVRLNRDAGEREIVLMKQAHLQGHEFEILTNPIHPTDLLARLRTEVCAYKKPDREMFDPT